MYTYETEILTVSTKWFSDKANSNDIAMLDEVLNKSSAFRQKKTSSVFKMTEDVF